MRYIKVALLTIVFCLAAIVFSLLAAFVWAQITKEKPETVSLYSEDTTLVEGFITLENTDKIVRFSTPKNMFAGFVYPSMEGYTKNTADCIRAGSFCENAVSAYVTGKDAPYIHRLKMKPNSPAGIEHNIYDGLDYKGRYHQYEYYLGRLTSPSCFGDEAERQVVFNCSGMHRTRVCQVYSPATADGFYFDYIVNEKFLTDWQTLHNRTCGLLRSFVFK